jgi:phosphatidylglycerol:prolipoprotein diacylglycerol transferase
MEHPALTHWVHDLDPVAIHIHGNFGIRYYGLAYLLAFVAAVAMLYWFHRKGRSPLGPEQIETTILALAAGVLLGGRLGYILLYDFPDFLRDPLVVFRVWEGGMASHGGFIGVMLALAWLSRKFKIPFLRLGDLLCPIVPLGLFFGRVANFINGELWGKPSDAPWAVIFPLSAPPGTPLEQIAPRHPSQLYEAFLEGAVLFVYMQWRFWRTGAAARPGQLSGEFLLFYALVRILGEQFREPDAGLILGLSRGIFYSLFLAVAGVGLIVHARRKERVKSEG